MPRPSMAALNARMWKAGYSHFAVILDGGFGYCVEVAEDVRSKGPEPWPALWEVASQLGIARGGAGTKFQQIKWFDGIECGFSVRRDLNAAANLEQLARESLPARGSGPRRRDRRRAANGSGVALGEAHGYLCKFLSRHRIVASK